MNIKDSGGHSWFCVLGDHAFKLLVYCSLISLLLFICKSTMFCSVLLAYAMSRAGTTPKVIYGLFTSPSVILMRSNVLVSIVLISPFSGMQFPPAWMNPAYLPILLLNFRMVPRCDFYHHCCYKYGFSNTCT